MTMRITLTDEDVVADVASSIPYPAARRAAPDSPAPIFADWDDDRSPTLLLFLAEEPEIGRQFSYDGVDWEIIDYRDGWVARLLVG
jgi:hypothetical protein